MSESYNPYGVYIIMYDKTWTGVTHAKAASS